MSGPAAKYVAFVLTQPSNAQRIDNLLLLATQLLARPESLFQLEVGFSAARLVKTINDTVVRAGERVVADREAAVGVDGPIGQAALGLDDDVDAAGASGVYGGAEQDAEGIQARPSEVMRRLSGGRLLYNGMCDFQTVIELLIRRTWPVPRPMTQIAGAASTVTPTSRGLQRWPTAHKLIFVFEIVKVILRLRVERRRVAAAALRAFIAPSASSGSTSSRATPAEAADVVIPQVVLVTPIESEAEGDRAYRANPSPVRSNATGPLLPPPSAADPAFRQAPVAVAAGHVKALAPVTVAERVVALLDLLQYVRPLALSAALLPFFRPSRGVVRLPPAGMWRVWLFALAVELLFVLTHRLAKSRCPITVSTSPYRAAAGEECPEEREEMRAAERQQGVLQYLARPPFFSLYLRPVLERWFIFGGLANIPLLGGIIGHHVNCKVRRLDACFTDSLGSSHI